MTVISAIGSDIATLDPTQHKLVKCIGSGSGYIDGHFYMANTAETGYIDISAASAANVRSNPKYLDLSFVKQRDLVTASWTESNSSTGDCVDDTDGTTGEFSIKLSSGATSGSRAQITQAGLKQDFGLDSVFQFKSRIGTLSSLNLRGGVNVDPVTSADSNNAHYGAEICTATNNNWFIDTGDGGAHNKSDSTIAATTNRQALKLEHYATGTIKVLLYIDSNAAAQSTTAVPSTGDVGQSNDLIRFSLKNSTGSDRTWFMYGCRLAYSVSDNWV